MVNQLTRSAARIYGALSALGDGSINVLERLLPFFEPLLMNNNGHKLDPESFAREVRDTYRWNFNTDLVEAFVPYLCAQGWLTKDVPSTSPSTYTITLPTEEQAEAKDSTVDAELRGIAIKFKDFTRNLSPLTSVTMELEDYENILVEWLLYVEAFSDKSIDFSTSLKPDETGQIRQQVTVPATTSLTDEQRFLCARFVKHSLSQDEGTAEAISKIASIGLLTEVVQDFVKPLTSVERTDLVVYLDAPVALELVGVSGRAAQENTAPLIAELVRIGAQLRIFGQSVEEMKRNLQSMLKNERPVGPTAQALRRQEVMREYVVQVAHDPIPILEKYDVKVAYRTLEQTPSEHLFFTKENYEDFLSSLTYSESMIGREHDADITTFTIRQRRGHADRDLFKSKCIVVTRNGLLAQLSRRKCDDFGLLPRGAIPPVIHRRALTTAIWLRTGMGGLNLNIPKRMLLASCERVLELKPAVVNAVKRVVDSLDDEEKAKQLDLLVAQDRSAQVLMDKTLGAVDVVTADNIQVLFSEMLQPHLDAETSKREEAVKEERAKGRQKLHKAKELLHEAKSEQSKFVSQLEAKNVEDRVAIDALCAAVQNRLALRKRIRIVFAVLLAFLSILPSYVDLSPSMKTAGTILLWFLSYLTITGGKFVSISASSTVAMKALQDEARSRGLTAKLKDFEISWSDDKFKIDQTKTKDSSQSLV